MTTEMRNSKDYPVEHGPRQGETIIFLHGGNMAGWTWDLQVEAMPGRHLLTPDLPGYGRNTHEVWPGIAEAADRMAALIRSHSIGGRAHIVGLSLGGFVAIELIRRHPTLAYTCTISGSPLLGYTRWERMVIGAQVPRWHRRWYWSAQSRPFNIPAEDRELFVQTASSPQPLTNTLLFRELGVRALPAEPFSFTGPVLAVAAEHDTPSVRRSFDPLRKCLPQLRTWVAPGMHHAWSAENPELFARMVATHADTGRWPQD